MPAADEGEGAGRGDGAGERRERGHAGEQAGVRGEGVEGVEDGRCFGRALPAGEQDLGVDEAVGGVAVGVG